MNAKRRIGIFALFFGFDELHAGATWLHVRAKTEGTTDANELSQYWLALG